MKDKWIQNAIKKPGSFTKQSKKADMTTSEFASKVKRNPEDFTSRTRKRAALARTLSSMNK
jgi:hypothetical protein